jgi:hypothetical protein
MTVNKFKKTGDIYFIQYEENKDIKSIKTEDEPESDFIRAMDDVALALLKLFKISDVTCKLSSIEWKDGEKAGSKAALLSGESTFGQFKMQLPKVTTQQSEDPEAGEFDPENFKDQYNQAADYFREQVEKFTKGARKQRPLPFKDPAAPKKNKRGVLGAVADKAAGLFGN